MAQTPEVRPRMLGAAAAGAAAVIPPLGAFISALNWRHFGKRDWMINSLLILFLYVVLLALGFVLLLRQQNTTVAVVILLGALLLFWTFYMTTQFLQNGAYKHWVKYNTLDNYHYNFAKAIGLGVGVVVLATVAVGVLFFFQSRPNTFTHTDLTISVPSSWAIRSLNELPDCAAPTDEYTCIGFFADSQFGFTQIYITRQRDYAANLTLQDHANDWQYFVGNQQGGRFVSISDTSLAGLPAKQIAAYFPPSAEDRLQEEDYTETLLVQRNGYLYTVLVWAENKAIFEENRRQIEAFLNAVTFV